MKPDFRMLSAALKNQELCSFFIRPITFCDQCVFGVGGEVSKQNVKTCGTRTAMNTYICLKIMKEWQFGLCY